MATWYISTPDWTIAVTQTHGTITAIAPILRSAWMGKPWRAFSAWVRQHYAGQWVARRLPTAPAHAVDTDPYRGPHGTHGARRSAHHRSPQPTGQGHRTPACGPWFR
jgi:hypothetical protein